MDTVLPGRPYRDVHRQLAHFHVETHISGNPINHQGDGANHRPENARGFLTASTSRAPPTVWLMVCEAIPRYSKQVGQRQFPSLFTHPIRIVCYMSILAVHKRHIVQHPRERYESLLMQLRVHANPEAGGHSTFNGLLAWWDIMWNGLSFG